MGKVGGRLYFAPGVEMKDVPLEQPDELIEAFESRIAGFFLDPIRQLATPGDQRIGGMFAAALLVAALVESIVRVERRWKENGGAIRTWLEEKVPGFDTEVFIKNKAYSVASVFEYQYRNGLAHNGYVASRGRLSVEIDNAYLVEDDVVTIDPFKLATEVEEVLQAWLRSLRDDPGRAAAFQFRVSELFSEEVQASRADAG